MPEETTVNAASETASGEVQAAVENNNEVISSVTGSEPIAEQVPAELEKTEDTGSEPAKPLGEKGVAELIHLRKRAQEAEREREYYRGLAEGKGSSTQAQVEPVKQVVQELVEPSIDDFDNYDDFVVAKAEYKIGIKARLEEERRQVVQKEETWQERLKKASEKIPDITDSMVRIDRGEIPFNKEMAYVIKDSEFGPQVADYLVKNPSESKRLANLHPVTMAREIGKIELKIMSQEAATKPKNITQAPDPIRPGSTRTSVVNVDLNNASIDDFMARRNSETFVKAGNRLIPKR